MAGDWIKIEHTTSDKPEVVQMADFLKIDQDSVVGKLFRVWSWADLNSIDGDQIKVSFSFIDRLAGKRRFAEAMRSVGWLIETTEGLSFSNFGRHNGASAKARAMENRKKASQRGREKCPGECPENVPVSSGQIEGQKGGPEKRREEKNNTTNPPPTPPPAASAENEEGDADGRHHAITARWGDLYRNAFASAYVFQGRDAATLKRFLRTCKEPPDDVLAMAARAWARTRQDRFARHCKQAATIHGLCTHYNDIRLELETPTQAGVPATVDRFGSVRSRKF